MQYMTAGMEAQSHSGFPKSSDSCGREPLFINPKNSFFRKFLVQLQIVVKKYYLYFLIPLDLVLYLIWNLGQSGVLGKMFAHRTRIA